MRDLIIYGAGGHGKVVADAAILSGRTVKGFIDDKAPIGFEIMHTAVIARKVSDLLLLRDKSFEVIVAIGDNRIRMGKIAQLLSMGISIATVIHPSAIIGDYVGVQTGAFVCAGAIINTHTVVGVGSIVNTGATLDHDNFIGPYVHICPGVHMGGNVVVKEGAHVSIGCSVRDKVCIGKWSVVGVGSVVVKDIPNNVVVYGCPAKVHKELQY